MNRRRLVAGFWLTFVGLLLAVFVASYIPGVPPIPACSTEPCNAETASSAVGLTFVLIGMILLGAGLFQKSEAPPPASSNLANPLYAFTAPPPSGVAPGGNPPPPAAAAPLPAVRTCPGCGAAITSSYGFCPRCGRTLSP